MGPVPSFTTNKHHFTGDCDYNYGPYRATFKAGNQQAVFRINIFDDDIYEKSEGFEFMIANTSTHAVSVCPPNRGSVIIMDDEESKQFIQYICIIIIVVLTEYIHIVCLLSLL